VLVGVVGGRGQLGRLSTLFPTSLSLFLLLLLLGKKVSKLSMREKSTFFLGNSMDRAVHGAVHEPSKPSMMYR